MTYISRAISTFLPSNFAAGRSTAKNNVDRPSRKAELPTNQCSQSNTHRFEVPGCGRKYAIIGCARAHRMLAKP